MVNRRNPIDSGLGYVAATASVADCVSSGECTNWAVGVDLGAARVIAVQKTRNHATVRHEGCLAFAQCDSR